MRERKKNTPIAIFIGVLSKDTSLAKTTNTVKHFSTI